jgi:hypothetical protein
VSKLQLEEPASSPRSPQHEAEEDNHLEDQDDLESRATRSRAGSAASHRSAGSSIYDYLDALESESAGQLPSIVSRTSSAPSYRARQARRPAKEFAWEEGSRRSKGDDDFENSLRSPLSSCRSTCSRREDNNLHQYYVGIKEKLATITIELNVGSHRLQGEMVR